MREPDPAPEQDQRREDADDEGRDGDQPGTEPAVARSAASATSATRTSADQTRGPLPTTVPNGAPVTDMSGSQPGVSAVIVRLLAATG